MALNPEKLPSDTPDTLRAAAKRLKKAFATGDADAVRRLRAFVPGDTPPKHADFLHVIARESGHDSWPKLKFALEAAAMTRAQRAARLEHGLRFGQNWVVAKLLDGDPDLASTNLGLQCATYDVAAVKAALERNPAAATEVIGDRAPLLHLAFSKYIHMAPERRAAMLEIVQLLVAHGANVNDGCPAEPGSDHKLSALYGALGHADNMALAEWLLDHGADPNDGESVYHATELSHHDGLRLLIKHGVRLYRTNALPRALDFNDPVSVRLLLDHRAALWANGIEPPPQTVREHITNLHHAARRWCSAEIANLLLDAGEDAATLWQGHTPYAVARIYGNQPFAEALAARGAPTALSPTEAVLAACAAGQAPAHKFDASTLACEDQLLLNRLIWLPVPDAHVATLIAAGLDFDKPDGMGLTPLHYAGWEGLAERVAYLISLGANLEQRNVHGGNALGATLHGAEFCPKAKERDHLTCVRLLLDAGAVLDPHWIDGCGNEEVAQYLEERFSAATGK